MVATRSNWEPERFEMIGPASDPFGDANLPAAFELPDGERVNLGPLAADLCDLFLEAHPDLLTGHPEAQRRYEHEQEGRYILAWALEDASTGNLNLLEQVAWLGRVRTGRGHPGAQLAGLVRLAAAVIETQVGGAVGTLAAERLLEAAAGLGLQNAAR